jgi:hypothetical protein
MAPKVGEKGPAKKGPAKKAADGKAKKKKVSKAETYKIYIYSERLQGGWELPRFERRVGLLLNNRLVGGKFQQQQQQQRPTLFAAAVRIAYSVLSRVALPGEPTRLWSDLMLAHPASSPVQRC